LLALFNTLAEIIGRKDLLWPSHLTIFEKRAYITRTKKCQESSKSKKPSSDDFGRISV
jgi:hypothetical protein